jgi:L-rhamnose isomerase
VLQEVQLVRTTLQVTQGEEQVSQLVPTRKRLVMQEMHWDCEEQVTQGATQPRHLLLELSP